MTTGSRAWQRGGNSACAGTVADVRPSVARAALLVVLSMMCFSVADVLAAQLARDLSPVALAWARYTMLAALLLPLATARPSMWRTRRLPLHLTRTASQVASALFFMAGFQRVPVAEATAMVFAAPLFVTVLAVAVLRERVAARDWLPVLLGFAGVLVVVRPGSSTFGWAALFPIASSLAWAVAVICTRHLASTERPGTSLLIASVTGALLLSTLLREVNAASLATHVLPLACMGLAWSVGLWLTVAAHQSATAGTLAPFSYTQLLWTSLLSMAIFSHVPDAASCAGMAIILASGVLAGWRALSRA
jgi:drug/metabolite transporter (DMT)-like permease